MSDEIVLDTGPDTRLVVHEYDDQEGVRAVAVVSERWDGQEWTPVHALSMSADLAWVPGPLFAAASAAVQLLTGGLMTAPAEAFQC